MQLKLSVRSLILLFSTVMSTTACKKDVLSSSAEFGNVPRSEVPEPFVGTFTYVTSTGGYVDQYGQYTPGVAQGITLIINQNGTGSALYHVETGSYSGTSTTDEIRSKCTYEVTKTSANHADMIIHYVSGQNYHNGKLLHDLDASKLYPNGDAVWKDVEYGTDNEGQAIFIVGTPPNSAQFTRQ